MYFLVFFSEMVSVVKELLVLPSSLPYLPMLSPNHADGGCIFVGCKSGGVKPGAKTSFGTALCRLKGASVMAYRRRYQRQQAVERCQLQKHPPRHQRQLQQRQQALVHLRHQRTQSCFLMSWDREWSISWNKNPGSHMPRHLLSKLLWMARFLRALVRLCNSTCSGTVSDCFTSKERMFFLFVLLCISGWLEPIMHILFYL